MEKYDIGVKLSKMKLKDLLNCIEYCTKITIINYYNPKNFKHKIIFHGRYIADEELKPYYDKKVIYIALNEIRGIMVIKIKEEVK